MKNKIKILKRSWTYLTVKFITKLLLVVEKNIILVVYNRLSKIIYFVITIKWMSVKKLARLFRNNNMGFSKV